MITRKRDIRNVNYAFTGERKTDILSESRLVILTSHVCQAQKVIEDTLFTCENRTRNGLALKSGTIHMAS